MFKFKDKNVFFVGIKGTGMAALAELFKNRGASVSGVDIEEKFYTDKILQDLKIDFKEKFSKDNIDKNIDFVIYSAAYNPESSLELQRAKELNIQCLSYPEALGILSKSSISVGVCGVHGKTTTTALCGSLVKSLNLDASVLVGSSVVDFGDRSTFYNGDKFFIAETCEYKKHFLEFSPTYIILTSVELDHIDYFKTYKDIENAFIEYCCKLPPNGVLIYCADDRGAVDVVNSVKKIRDNIRFISYGKNANSDFKLSEIIYGIGENYFKISAYDKTFKISIPGDHIILNANSAITLLSVMAKDYSIDIDENFLERIYQGFSNFKGCKRRSEIVGEVNGILIIDDYAHHPTAINLTLSGYKKFYKDRKIVVDFMSHTYSRTEALLDDFAKSFGSADTVLLNKIYASAREKQGTITGETLFNLTKKYHTDVHYFDVPLDALNFLQQNLKAGDIFITMGAGNNDILGRKLYEVLKGGTV